MIGAANSDNERDRAARTIAAHLEALQSWGIERVRVGVPTAVPTEETSTPSPHAPILPGPSATAPNAAAPSETAAPETPAAPTPATDDPRIPQLDTCRAEVAACERCALAESRTQTVFGVGNPHASLVFVGEAPGRDEDLQGEPFVGKAGQLLNKIIAAMGLRREDVYIANVLKCRPPNNRDPQPQEVGACTPYLERQIDLIRPEMIVALGRPAANYLLETTEPLGRLRGRTHDYRGIPVVATYHPAYLLRNPAEKKKVWQDLQAVIQFLDLTPVTARPQQR